MLLRSLRATRRRRTRTFAAITAAAFALGAIACGIDAVATKVYPDLPTSEAGEASLPKNDGPDEPDADAGTDAPLACPTAKGAMVMVDAGGLFFCIDATEVTTSAYDAFVLATDGGKLDSGVFDAGAPDACAGNGSYQRGPSAAADASDLPVSGIDWCDAHDYCRWASKRLCAKHVASDASTGEWYSACSNGGKQAFAYGPTLEAGACNDSLVVKPVKSYPACQGSVPGLYDMNGNLSEWVDNCASGMCTAMGGYFAQSTGCAVDYEYARTLTDPTLGFRCCAEPR